MHWLIFKFNSTIFRTTTATIRWLLFSNLHFHVSMAYILLYPFCFKSPFKYSLMNYPVVSACKLYSTEFMYVSQYYD